MPVNFENRDASVGEAFAWLLDGMREGTDLSGVVASTVVIRPRGLRSSGARCLGRDVPMGCR